MSTEKEANELKQQGAMEAARDPESQVTAEDAGRMIVDESRKAGVMAIELDPDASLEERRAKMRDAVPANFHNPNRPKGISLVTDLDDENAASKQDLPDASNNGVIDAPMDKDGKIITDGRDPTDKEKELPFARVGWEPQFGWPHEDILEGESFLNHDTWLESQIPDHLFGDWYYNAGVIIFACLASWVVAALGGGLGWVFIIMSICACYYRTSIRRVRRNFRDDITREMHLKNLETDFESVEWMNAFLVKFWPIYQPVLSETIVASVDQILSYSTPTFLDSLRLKKFVLGSKPPRIEHIKSLYSEDDYVVMDWQVSFTPNDTADMTAKQLKYKINPKIVLEIRVGKAMISKGLDVIVEDMAFSGTMRLKMKLQIPWPHIEKIDLSFLGKPKIDYVCKPLGGDTFGFDINFIPGIESFILEQIHATLAPMMYAPNVFPIEIAKMLAWTPVDQAIGVVAITLHGAHGLKGTDNFGTIDPFAQLSLNRRAPLARTKVAKEDSNPRWNETHYIIVTSLTDSLNIEIIDHNEFRKSKTLGVASFPLENLAELSAYENERLEVVSAGKARGILSCDVRFFPVLEAKPGPDGISEPLPDSNQGVLRFTVEQASELDGSKSMVGQLNPYAILLLNGRPVHTTKKLKRTNKPIWDNGFTDILIQDRKHAKLGVIVKDDRELAGDQTLGAKQVKLDDLLHNMQEGKEWYYLDGATTGKVKMTAQWKPVSISGILGGTGGYITPIGVLRLHFMKAVDLRNFEAMGKSDPYVRVLLSGIEKARTVTFKNNLDPEWDEVLYVPIHSARDRLILEVMDAEKVGKDRSLGAVELSAGELVNQLESGEYEVNDKTTVREEGLKLEKKKGTEKGTLIYTAIFYPCLNIADPEEDLSEDEKSVASGIMPNGTTENGDALPKTPASADFPPIGPAIVRKSSELSLPPVSPTTATATAPQSPVSPRKSREEPKGPPLVHLSPQDLLKHESGLVLVRLIEADLPKANCHIEIYVDDMAFPSYVSSVARARSKKYEEIGDCFIRELEWSHLTIKIREKGEKAEGGDKDHTLAYLSGDTLSTLKQCLNNPTTLKLKSKDEEGRPCSVKISLKYLPVRMQLDASESINNMGTLRVEALDAQGLPSADSNGKSDPFCKFELNGTEVFKTKVQKKTLDPSWNEFFEVSVPSRTAAKFSVTVWDWDLGSNDDFLGDADIELMDLEPFSRKEKIITLRGARGRNAGTVRLRLLFTPNYIKRTRQGTSSFTNSFAAPSRLVSGVTGAPSKLGQNINKSASFLKRGFTRRKDDSVSELPTIPNGNGSVPPISNGHAKVPTIGVRRPTNPPDTAPPVSPPAVTDSAPQPSTSAPGSSHSRTKSFGASSVHSAVIGVQVGTATFTIVQAVDFPPSADIFVAITQILPKQKTVGKTRDHKASNGVVKFEESFRFQCTPEAQFQVSVRGKHTFKSDDQFGEALYHVDDSGSGAQRELPIGSGVVTIKSAFVPSQGSNEALVPDSPQSTFRRSLLPKRDGRSVSRDATPQL